MLSIIPSAVQWIKISAKTANSIVEEEKLMKLFLHSLVRRKINWQTFEVDLDTF